METLDLRRADGTKTLSSPGTERSIDEVNSATDLSEDENVPKRVCMIINYFPQDGPDILLATKGMVREMSQPNTMAWEMAKRMWSVLKPRMVQRFAPHHPVDTITLSTETMQGAWETRRSTTGIAAYRGKHVIKGSIHDTDSDRVVER